MLSITLIDLAAGVKTLPRTGQMARLNRIFDWRSALVVPDGSAPPDYIDAAYWYDQAANRGDEQAGYDLAIL
jgi:hypothetical protein